MGRFAVRAGVSHLTWRGFFGSSLAGKRVLYAWPDRSRLDELWDCGADAVAVIAWIEDETAEWIEDAGPILLTSAGAVAPAKALGSREGRQPLPNGVDGILEYIAAMAAGYSSGLKWNEEDKLKADMRVCPRFG